MIVPNRPCCRLQNKGQMMKFTFHLPFVTIAESNIIRSTQIVRMLRRL